MSAHRVACRSPLGAALVLGALVTVAGSAGCNDEIWGPQRTSVRHYGFELSCAAELCGFDVTRGTAERVDAFVAGEHAMAISTTSRVAIGISLTSPSTWEGARFIARCDRDTSLRVEQRVYVWQRTDEGASTYAIAETSQQQQVRPVEEWGAFDVRFDARARHEFTQRVELSFSTEGAGGCVVDEINYATFDMSLRMRVPR